MSDVPSVITDNIHFVEQGMGVLEKMSDEAYTSTQAPFKKGGIGRHIRHVLDHYTLFGNGLDARVIDYDARARDIEVENTRQRAVLLFETTRHNLVELADKPINLECALQVRHNGTWCLSSIGRELQHLINHTVHHYAFVALISGLLGEDVAEDFGVAPSTLRVEMAE